MSGHCDFCGIWHSASCCHPGRAQLQLLQAVLSASEAARQQAEQEISSLHQFGRDWQREALAAQEKTLALSTALRALIEKWWDGNRWQVVNAGGLPLWALNNEAFDYCAKELEALLSSPDQEQP